jgi:hypothetical protein
VSNDPPIPTFVPEPARTSVPESPEAVRATQIANEFTRFATEIARVTRLATSFVTTKIATKAPTQAGQSADSPAPPPSAAPARTKTVLEEIPKPPPRARTRVPTSIAEPARTKTTFSDFVEEFDDGETEPESEPEPDLPINTTPTLLERGLALAEVGAEWIGALTQAAVQQAAQNIDHEMALKKERDERQYHLVVVKGNQSGEYLYVSGVEADEIEKRLRKEGWRVLRTPVS